MKALWPSSRSANIRPFASIDPVNLFKMESLSVPMGSLNRAETMDLFNLILNPSKGTDEDPILDKNANKPPSPKGSHQVKHKRETQNLFEAIFQCRKCDYWAYKSTDLKRHESKHETESKSMKRTTIQKSVKPIVNSFIKTKRQTNAFNVIDGKIYQCRQCSVWSYHQHIIRNHILKHLANPE